MNTSINEYILNIEPDKIVDRDEYVDIIRKSLNEKDKSKIIFIASKTAVGKSSVVSKVLNDNDLKQTIIRIRTLPLNTSEKNDEWDFFQKIFDELKENSPYSFEKYINSARNQTHNRMILDYIVNYLFSNIAPQNYFLPLIYLFASWYLKIGKFDVNNLIYDNSIKSRRIKYQYVKFMTQKYNIIFAIDNIQNIDKQSLEDIRNLINETKDNAPKFIFEYTISEKHPLEEFNILSENLAATLVETQIIHLKNLEKKYIVDAVSRHLSVPSKAWNFSVNLQNEYEKKESGNIREMIDYSLCYSNSLNKEDVEYTLENIISLPEHAKVLLAIIIHCNGAIPIKQVNILGHNIQLDIAHSILILKKKLIIEEAIDGINLAHASLADQWKKNNNNFETYDNIAYNALKDYFEDIVFKSPPQSTTEYDGAWLNLIRLYSRFDQKNLISLFDFLDKDIRKIISTQNAWLYIKQIIDVTDGNIDSYEELYLNIIRFCFESELYCEGYNFIEHLLKDVKKESLRNMLLIYKAMFFSALDRHAENIKYCCHLINIFSKSSKEYYNLKLISLSSYRSLGEIDECYKIHKELINDQHFMTQFEWGYFLRLCEMYLDRNKSQKFLRKSINFFKKNNDVVQTGKSLISYSYIIASQGKLKKAEQQINLAQDYLKNTRMGNHMFLVNKAAILLLSGNYTENVWEMLNEAEITTVVPFDKLAIITNKLVWCIENLDSDRESLIIKDAMDLLKSEPDLHIHGLIYYNIYYLLRKKGNSLCTEFLKKAQSVKEYCKPVKSRLDCIAMPETKFALSKPWHVCFLAYWTYDLKL